MYEGYQEFLSERFLTGEEMLDAAADRAGASEKLADTWVVLDGFTGFTPVQHRLLRELLKRCPKVTVLLTLDDREDPYHCRGIHRLFALTQQTVHTLCVLAKEAGTEIQEGSGKKYPGRIALQGRRSWLSWSRIYSGTEEKNGKESRKRSICGRRSIRWRKCGKLQDRSAIW